MLVSELLNVYTSLIGWTGLGWILGRLLPKSMPAFLGKFLFWIGVPISIVAFLRHAVLSPSLWIAPATAWVAIVLGGGLAWWVSRSHSNRSDRRAWDDRSRGSFLLTSMVGNTGYIGFPVSLALVGPTYFPWALFYDMLGSTPGAYGLGVVLASHFGTQQQDWRQFLRAIVQNPALWSFGIGLLFRDLALPVGLETSLRNLAWCIVALALILVGMRLSQLTSFNRLKPALLSVGIKMTLVPLVLGVALHLLGITGPIHRAILLQMGMPPAFATLVITEAYTLDQDLTVTTLVLGCIWLFVMLPVWLWLFGSWSTS